MHSTLAIVIGAAPTAADSGSGSFRWRLPSSWVVRLRKRLRELGAGCCIALKRCCWLALHAWPKIELYSI